MLYIRLKLPVYYCCVVYLGSVKLFVEIEKRIEVRLLSLSGLWQNLSFWKTISISTNIFDIEISGTMISVDQSTNDKGQDETKGNNVEEVDARLLPVEENTTSEEKEQLRWAFVFFVVLLPPKKSKKEINWWNRNCLIACSSYYMIL